MPKTWRPVVVGCALALAVLLGHLGVLQSMLEALQLGYPAQVRGEVARAFITRSVRLERPAPVAPKAPAAPVAKKPVPVIPPIASTGNALAATDPSPLVPLTSSGEAGPVDPSLEAPTPPAEAVVAAEADASPPRWSLLLPGSTRLRYKVHGVIKGFQYYVNGELLWLHDGKTYDARLEISHFLLGARVQTSKGQVTLDGLEPLRFGDKVRSEVAAHFERQKGRVSFSANTPDAPLQALAQDQLSVFMQLAAMFAGEPKRIQAGMALPFQAVGPRSSENWVFQVGKSEILKLDAGPVPAVGLVRERTGEYDTRVELWLAPGLDYLPARIRLTQSNGDEVDMQWISSQKP